MADTLQQVIAGVYTLLRRVSDIKLPPQDVLERMNDILKGLVQDMDLGGRDQRTEVALVDVIEDDIDYRVSLPNVPDFEPVALEYGMTSAGTQSWRQVQQIPYDTRSRHYAEGYVSGSFYGSSALQQGPKLWLNINPAELENVQFRLTYRLPLLTIVQTGERPPIPSNFLPMLKLETALTVMPMVSDDTEEWQVWVKGTQPIYAAALQEWKERWREYMESSVEPNIQQIRPFNSFRRRGRVTPRAYLPIQ